MNSSNTKIFKLMCEYIKPRFKSLLAADPVEFEIKLSSATSSIKTALKHEVNKDDMNEMINEFNLQVRSAYDISKSNNINMDEEYQLIPVPDSVRIAAKKALEKHDLWPHFGTPDAMSTARVLAMFPFISDTKMGELADHFNSTSYSNNKADKWTKNLYGGDECVAWVSRHRQITASAPVESQEGDCVEKDPTLADMIVDMFKEAHSSKEEKIDDRTILEKKRESYMKISGYIN